MAKIVKKYETTASRLADWLEKYIPEGLTVFDFSVTHRRKIQAVNGLERVSQEVKRRPLFHSSRTLAAPEGYWTAFTENKLHDPGKGKANFWL
jgi:transposase-like protein